MRIALVTPSFRRDHALCADLCASVDAYDRDGLEHVVIVPRSDLSLFAPLASERRRIVAQESVLPRWAVKVPFPAVVTLPGVGTKRIRTLWLTPRGPVRGWIMQQIIKLSVNRATDADGYVFLDSDVVFVRPFGAATFLHDGRLPLHMAPGDIDRSVNEHDEFAAWQDAACDLLGIARRPFEGDNYVATVVCWRRDRLEELQARIEAVSGMSFQAALLRQGELSEYVLYGLYCHLVAEGDAGHVPQTRSICHEDWNYDTSAPQELDAFVDGLGDHHVAVLMQSTNDWSIDRRRTLVSAIRGRAGLS